MEVVKIMTISRFSKIREAISFAESDDTLEGSNLPLMIADIRSNGELDDDCIAGRDGKCR